MTSATLACPTQVATIRLADIPWRGVARGKIQRALLEGLVTGEAVPTAGWNSLQTQTRMHGPAGEQAFTSMRGRLTLALRDTGWQARGRGYRTWQLVQAPKVTYETLDGALRLAVQIADTFLNPNHDITERIPAEGCMRALDNLTYGRESAYILPRTLVLESVESMVRLASRT
jgi:hypothetical protein